MDRVWGSLTRIMNTKKGNGNVMTAAMEKKAADVTPKMAHGM